MLRTRSIGPKARRGRTFLTVMAIVMLGACEDITGLDQKPLEIAWLEFPTSVPRDSAFEVRVVAAQSSCDRVTSLRVSRRDTIFLVTARVRTVDEPCVAVIAELDTIVDAEAGDGGRFVIVTGGRSFGRLDVIDPGSPDTTAIRGRVRGSGDAVPVRRDGCVALENPAGLQVPTYPTTGDVAVPGEVAASGFVRGLFLEGSPPPACPQNERLFRVESLELRIDGAARVSGADSGGASADGWLTIGGKIDRGRRR